ARPRGGRRTRRELRAAVAGRSRCRSRGPCGGDDPGGHRRRGVGAVRVLARHLDADRVALVGGLDGVLVAGRAHDVVTRTAVVVAYAPTLRELRRRGARPGSSVAPQEISGRCLSSARRGYG